MLVKKFRVAPRVGLGIVLASCSIVQPMQPNNNESTSYLTRVQTFASMLNTVVGGNGDPRTVVLPASVAYPVGTLLVTGGGAADICIIDQAAFAIPDPSVEWTPPIAADSQFSFALSVPAPILAALSSAQASVSRKSSASLSYADLTQHVALLTPFEKALTNQPCGGKISALLARGKVVTVVRGSISGRESFDFTQGVNASAGANVKSIGGFNVSFSNGVADSMSEQSPSVHFLITYNIPPPRSAGTAFSAPEASQTPTNRVIGEETAAPTMVRPSPEVEAELTKSLRLTP